MADVPGLLVFPCFRQVCDGHHAVGPCIVHGAGAVQYRATGRAAIREIPARYRREPENSERQLEVHDNVIGFRQ